MVHFSGLKFCTIYRNDVGIFNSFYRNNVFAFLVLAFLVRGLIVLVLPSAVL